MTVLLGIAAAVVLSSGVEVAQVLIPGRFPSGLDVLTNTAGATLGLLGIRTRHQWSDPSTRTADTLSVAAAALFAATAFATGFLTTPDLPRGSYVGQWVPHLGGYEPYRGSVHHVAVGPYDVPSHALEDSDQIRDLIIEGQRLRISGIAGPAPSSLSPIFGLVRQFRTQLLLVGVSGDDLVLRIRHRGASLRLDQSSQYGRGLMGHATEGSPFEIEVWRLGRTTCASVNGQRDCNFTPTLGEGWGLLVNASPRSAMGQSLLNGVWLALLALPVGFWLRRSPGALAALLILVTAAGAAPPLTSLRSTPVEQWLAIGVGVGVGMAARHLVRLMSESRQLEAQT